MFRRELKLNFSELETITTSLCSYKRALEDLERTMTSIQANVQSAQGLAAISLKTRHAALAESIREQKAATGDLFKIFSDYIAYMKGHIRPKVNAQLMIVDNGLGTLGQQSYRITVDAGRVIGTKGQTTLIIVVDDLGNVWTAWPD